MHCGIHAVAASPSSWSTGLPLISLPRGMENCRSCFHQGCSHPSYELAPPTSASHIQQPFLSDSVIPGLQMLLRATCYCAHLSSKTSPRATASSGQALVDHYRPVEPKEEVAPDVHLDYTSQCFERIRGCRYIMTMDLLSVTICDCMFPGYNFNGLTFNVQV